MKFIIKLFPEIMVKGHAVKKKMVNQLHFNLRNLLGRGIAEVETKRYWDKIEVFCQPDEADFVRQVLLNTPGIEQFLEVEQFYTTSLDEVAQLVADFALPKIDGKSFVVRVKRTGNHSFSSFDMERTIGACLCRHGNPAKVDLHHPDVKIELEYHQDQLNIVKHRRPGLGGFPLGSQGDVLSLMSGGFDSTVASYLTIRRGLKTHFIFFNLGGAAHEIGVKQVALYLWEKFSASHRVMFVTIPFENVVAEIFRSTPEPYMGVTLKRLMIMAAEKVADDMGIDALVTGESVAQVSSQTLRNLALIDQVSEKLVLRPLAVMSKPDIMAIADQIGTREFAENMPEYCGVISQNPITHGSFKRMAVEAKKFDYRVLDQAVASAEAIPVDSIIENVNQAQAVEIIDDVGPDDVVIDIRKSEMAKAHPLSMEGVLTIPFHELNRAFKKLDASKRYLLYCQKGVMSQLHAQYLRDAGFQNVKVYRPKSTG
ncbi:tRNA uracil 4-sulfurtransferase ThiI [Hydrogenovibrio thermophilus]|uniref:tRNA sulfurtransferase n=1 Tax=Hydrogenovibrio thermophilus TaxID=265883 RepID=A0A410H3Z1_9GAMM|nr:tRNA uracil 4-sulfurtransferase ThiI [Hydrogenovibrio thermophilus]QAB15616.1 tRNA 4-thiouridine(8) synthase ThiI [Hydrogenovibrio thermophilus]